jgi:hypothetical protein
VRGRQIAVFHKWYLGRAIVETFLLLAITGLTRDEVDGPLADVKGFTEVTSLSGDFLRAKLNGCRLEERNRL